MKDSDSSTSHRSARWISAVKLNRWQVLLVFLSATLAIGAVARPYLDRTLNFHEDPAGQPYRMTTDSTIEYWRIVWDKVYLEWITIGIAAAASIALVRDKRPTRWNRRQKAVMCLGVSAVLLTCLFPCVHYTDSSNMPKPGERRSYQTPSGIWMSRDPLLPRFIQGDRFILADYNGVLWSRLAMEWAGIVLLTAALMLVHGRATPRFTADSDSRQIRRTPSCGA